MVLSLSIYKKPSLDYSKLVEICGGDTDGTYEIMITMNECKNKALNTNENIQILDISTDLKKFTKKDKNCRILY
jgi:hypothetical protein